jgi:hypothetical protein
MQGSVFIDSLLKAEHPHIQVDNLSESKVDNISSLKVITSVRGAPIETRPWSTSGCVRLTTPCRCVSSVTTWFREKIYWLQDHLISGDNLLITWPAWTQMKNPFGGCCSTRISVYHTLHDFIFKIHDQTTQPRWTSRASLRPDSGILRDLMRTT